jgi:hypothetical protein
LTSFTIIQDCSTWNSRDRHQREENYDTDGNPGTLGNEATKATLRQVSLKSP